MTTVEDRLKAAAELYASKNKLYKDNYKKIGKIYCAMFPNGITLKTEDDFNRFAILIQIMNKVVRYNNNWATGHTESLDDLMVYPAMLAELDGIMNRSQPFSMKARCDEEPQHS